MKNLIDLVTERVSKQICHQDITQREKQRIRFIYLVDSSIF